MNSGKSGRSAPETAPGRPLPLGARLTRGGANFALFSRQGTGVELLLFESAAPNAEARAFTLDPILNRTGDIWHIWVAGVRPGQCYAYRVDGPYQPERGLRFTRRRLLADPYAYALSGVSSWDFRRAREHASPASRNLSDPAREDNRPWSGRSVVIDHDFDWAGSRAPGRSWPETVIYETHVRGLTVHPSSANQCPGTYRGMIERIAYLKELGITAVELMPVQEFNENETSERNPVTGERLRNFWGYNPVGFFAPEESYSSSGAPGGQVREFKEMVRAFHDAGIEVILDVVFNHSAELDETGPTFGFRGLANPVYYLLRSDSRRYRDYSGCLNTINCNHPVVSDLIVDCLRTWVIDMRVDGFRFDLASIMARGEDGEILPHPPLLARIAADPILRRAKLIAEPWDAAGAFQVGGFYGEEWSEWNSFYRDDVRRFWLGDRGSKGALASRLCGSSDLFAGTGKRPSNSINFITCHDGFTLNDLVSYNDKHNVANAHDNRDGSDWNFSRNHGCEGECDDPVIEQLRLRQIKNMLATLFVSRGVPMLLGGDEFRRTQGGNNNAYCQDNATSWYDWNLLERNRELFRFTRELISFRRRHAVLSADRFCADEEVTWFDPGGLQPAWDAQDRALGCVVREPAGGSLLALLFNSEEHEISFRLPSPLAEFHWRIAVDTAAASPDDITAADGAGRAADPHRVRLEAKTLVVLTGTKS